MRLHRTLSAFNCLVTTALLLPHGLAGPAPQQQLSNEFRRLQQRGVQTPHILFVVPEAPHPAEGGPDGAYGSEEVASSEERGPRRELTGPIFLGSPGPEVAHPGHHYPGPPRYHPEEGPGSLPDQGPPYVQGGHHEDPRYGPRGPLVPHQGPPQQPSHGPVPAYIPGFVPHPQGPHVHYDGPGYNGRPPIQPPPGQDFVILRIFNDTTQPALGFQPGPVLLDPEVHERPDVVVTPTENATPDKTEGSEGQSNSTNSAKDVQDKEGATSSSHGFQGHGIVLPIADITESADIVGELGAEDAGKDSSASAGESPTSASSESSADEETSAPSVDHGSPAKVPEIPEAADPVPETIARADEKAAEASTTMAPSSSAAPEVPPSPDHPEGQAKTFDVKPDQVIIFMSNGPRDVLQSPELSPSTEKPEVVTESSTATPEPAAVSSTTEAPTTEQPSTPLSISESPSELEPVVIVWSEEPAQVSSSTETPVVPSESPSSDSEPVTGSGPEDVSSTAAPPAVSSTEATAVDDVESRADETVSSTAPPESPTESVVESSTAAPSTTSPESVSSTTEASEASSSQPNPPVEVTSEAISSSSLSEVDEAVSSVSLSSAGGEQVTTQAIPVSSEEPSSESPSSTSAPISSTTVTSSTTEEPQTTQPPSTTTTEASSPIPEVSSTTSEAPTSAVPSSTTTTTEAPPPSTAAPTTPTEAPTTTTTTTTAAPTTTTSTTRRMPFPSKAEEPTEEPATQSASTTLPSAEDLPALPVFTHPPSPQPDSPVPIPVVSPVFDHETMAGQGSTTSFVVNTAAPSPAYVPTEPSIEPSQPEITVNEIGNDTLFLAGSTVRPHSSTSSGPKRPVMVQTPIDGPPKYYDIPAEKDRPSTFPTQTIRTRNGQMKGVVFKTSSGIRVNSFLGIPYAQAPVNGMRFERPMEFPPWTGVFEAKKMPKSCPQPSMHLNGFVGVNISDTSEDCLYLNIWSPFCDGSKKCRPRPVVVYIHGGGFVYGGVNWPIFDGAELAGKGEVVVVTLNYRLGALGFLYVPSTGGGRPERANMGLYDQHLALRWVKSNIKAFGGDHNKITVMGQDAGAASVGYHILTPRSTGLFKRAIMQSGSPFSFVLRNTKDQGETLFRSLASYTDCAMVWGNSSLRYDDVLGCMKKLPYETIITATEKFNGKGANSFFPVLGDEFIPMNPKDSLLLKRFSNVDLLVSTTKMEGAFFLQHFLSSFTNINDVDKINPGEIIFYLRVFLSALLGGKPTSSLNELTPNTEPRSRAEKVEFLRNVSAVIGDYPFVCATTDFGTEYANLRHNVYHMQFDHRPWFLLHPSWFSATHFDDVMYWLGAVYKLKERSRADERVADELTAILTNFANKGTPQTLGKLTWPRINQGGYYMNIGSDFTELLRTSPANCDYFIKHFPQY